MFWRNQFRLPERVLIFPSSFKGTVFLLVFPLYIQIRGCGGTRKLFPCHCHNKQMELHFTFRIIITLLLFWFTAFSTTAQPIARPGCSNQCGGVTIPFPFGMERGCYLEESFQIYCNSSTSNRPFLNGVNLEVIEISAQKSTLQARFPIAYTDCGGRNSSGLVDLKGSPFVFSRSDNSFTAVGCNNLALITQDGSSTGGCMSICDDNNDVANVNVTCDGINCCQTRVPMDLKVFNATLRGIDDGRRNGTGQQCKFAYIVNQTWLEHSGLNPYTVGDIEYVPVALDWTIDARIYASFPNNSLGSNSTRSTSRCQLSNSTISSNQTIQCYCNYGFQGNPYLRNGCGDINECAEPENPCSKQNMKCENLYGSFRCYSPSPRAKMITLGLSVGFGSLLFLIISWWSYKALKKRKMIKLREKFFKRNGGLLLQEQLSSGEVNVENIRMFSSKELEKATDRYNPNRTLGQGGQGTVYKGMLTDGRIVAVKKSTLVGDEKLRHFINEVVILSQINHRNVVKLLGCCLETEVPMLVYEFIPNGTLSELLHNQNEEIPSTLDMRLRIATEVAGALSYLHSSVSMPIYHRDIKSTNILLDDKYRAKIADFGISRSITVDQTHVTTTVQGTFGYLDPEYFRSSQFTDKSDVYSFGVVLVELLTGQRPISQTKSEEIRGLVAYFFLAMEENRLFDILDVQVIMQGNKEDLVAVANLAKRCLNMTGKLRPTMKEVTAELERIQKLHNNVNLSQNHEIQQVQYNRYDLMDHWEIFSTSTRDTASSLDKKPILPKH